MQIENVDPKLMALYEGVRDVLKIYRSGKLPKAFRIIPSLRNWEQILYITGKSFFVDTWCAKVRLKMNFRKT